MTPRNSQNSFKIGEHVLCFEPDSSKAKVLYNAKVIDVETMTDKKGKNKPMYLIHFQGWNSSWDRLVPESFLLKDSEEHRQLMSQLTKICQQVRRNRARVENIDALLEKFFQSSSNDWLDSLNILDSLRTKSSYDKENNEVNYGLDDVDDDKTCSDLSTEMNLEDDTSICSSKSENSRLSKHSSDNEEDRNYEIVSLELSLFLREVLTKDFYNIKTKNMLVQLPVDQNVISILESAVKSYSQNLNKELLSRNKLHLRNQYLNNNSKNIDLCKETADSLRIAFDFTLPLLLLYNEEQEQYMKYLELQQEKTQGSREELAYVNLRGIKIERRTTRKSSVASKNSNSIPEKKRRTRSQAIYDEPVSIIHQSDKISTSQDTSSTVKDSSCNSDLNDNATHTADSSKYDGMSESMKNEKSGNSWHLLPTDATELPILPSSIYGAHHLARLFVKLPQLLGEMGISNVYLPQLKHHLHYFLEYLNQHPELFDQTVLISHS